MSNAYEIPPREKWKLLLSGEDAGPLVSPLCDDWSLDIPYYWPYDAPDPFPPGHKYHMLSQQMAMAKICGWDPLFIAGIDFIPKNEKILPQTRSYEANGRKHTEMRIDTPYGELSCIHERNENNSRIKKEWLVSKEDYDRMVWLTRQHMEYNEDAVIAQVRKLLNQVGDKGMLGTWVLEPIVQYCNTGELFYHMEDWPESFEELHRLTVELTLKKLDTLGKAGLDYIFYVVSGTEWSSPRFFRKWLQGPSRDIIKKWKGTGGFVLWHSCGHIADFIEEGFYNELRPDILETLSERPEGNIPSLRWARGKLDRKIVTKGNIRMEILQNGTEDEIRTAVNRVREETKGYRHIVGLSDDILHNTPLSNVKVFVDEAKKQT